MAKFLFTEAFSFYMKEYLSCLFGKDQVLSNFLLGKVC